MVQHLYISGKCLLYLVDFPNCCYNLGKFQVIFNNVSLIKPLTRKKKKLAEIERFGIILSAKAVRTPARRPHTKCQTKSLV